MAVTHQGTNMGTNGATTITIPTHQAGDIIVISAVTATAALPSAGGTVPTWAVATQNTTRAITVAWALATAANHTSGTWTGATLLAATVYRGAASSPVGGRANANAGAASPAAPSITLSDTSGGSQIHHALFAYKSSSGMTWNAAPAGYTARATLAPPASNKYGGRILTKDSTTSDGSVTNALNTTPTSGPTASVEIKAALDSGRFFAMF